MTTFHIHISVRGALAMKTKDFAKSYKNVFYEDDGKPIPTDVLRKRLEYELAMGHEIIPSQGCDNYDWKHGCKGHDQVEAAA